MEIKIGNYKGIEVEVKKVECSQEMVERQVQYTLNQNPVKESKEGTIEKSKKENVQGSKKLMI